LRVLGLGGHVSALFKLEEVDIVFLPFKLTTGGVGELGAIPRYLPRCMVVRVLLFILD
jgi:hypothetical protein